MKRIQLIIFMLLFNVTLFLTCSFAQDYPKWDLPDGARLRIGKGYVQNLRFSPDSKRLIVDSNIGLWSYDTHTAAEIDFIKEKRNYNFRFGPGMGLSWDAKMYVTIDTDRTLSVRNFLDSSVKISLNVQTEDVGYFTFSPDGNTLAVGINEVIHLWDLTTGVKKAPFLGHIEDVSKIAFSPDGTMLASAGYDDILKVWDVATARPKKTLSKYAWGVYDLVFSPDGKTLYTTSSGDRVRAWNIASGFANYVIYPDSIYCIALSPDGKTLAGGFQGLHLWDAKTGQHKAELTGHLRTMQSIAFSPDGKLLASGGSDELFIWDAKTGARKIAISGHTSGSRGLAFSPDNHTIVTSSSSKIEFWDTSTGQHKTTFYTSIYAFNQSMDFNPEGTILASVMDQRIDMWDVGTGALRRTIRGSGGSNGNKSGFYISIAFNPDGSLLAGANNDTTIQLWYDGRTRKGALLGHTDSVNAIDFNFNGRVLVSGSSDKTVRLWDVIGEKQIAMFSGHKDVVRSVAFSPDARLVASGGKDKTVILWDLLTGNIKHRMIGHTDEIYSVAFSKDGDTIVSSGGKEDPTVRLWDIVTGEEIRTLTEHSSTVYKVKFSPDGKTLASMSGDGIVMLWDYKYFRDGKKDTVYYTGDVNRDGVVDLQDLTFVASQFGQTGVDNAADVDGDGVVSIADLLTVAAALENDNGAPSRITKSINSLDTDEVTQWLKQAQQANIVSPAFQKGTAMLELILRESEFPPTLAELPPTKTLLLQNYPNPFNPETWIPYQLRETANVTIRIRTSDGQLVRTLKLGKQTAGAYLNKNRAAYWDGKNEYGEPIASGIYFYTLTTDKSNATQRMIIQK